jgi:hypothetical protein
MNKALKVSSSPFNSKNQKTSRKPDFEPSQKKLFEICFELMVFHIRSNFKTRLIEQIGELKEVELNRPWQLWTDITTLKKILAQSPSPGFRPFIPIVQTG